MGVMHLHYDVSGEDFTHAGEASSQVKSKLRQLGISPDAVRRAAIALYEGEINLVIHAGGGQIDVDISPVFIDITLTDHGPGIANIEMAMTEGYSTASENIRSLGFGAGMGLPNMKRYSDEMKIDTKCGEGTTIYMKIALV